MLDYFLSPDWAIIATELLAGFIVISLILAVLLWRGQRRHTGAAERLLDDRDPIMRASEEMVDRQIQRVWPELELDDEQRESYAERSLDAIEAMVEPWLEPRRYELAAVARRFLQVRQADLEQLLTLARAHAEASDEDDARLAELENDIKELRELRDRQAKQLNESLETINVMVREYGRKFDYNDEPHVATLLKAIVMVQEMDAGADCETAKRRAEEVFSEELVATSSAPAEGGDEPAPPPAPETGASAAVDGTTSPALSPEEEMAAAMEAQAAGQQSADDSAQQPPDDEPPKIGVESRAESRAESEAEATDDKAGHARSQSPGGPDDAGGAEAAADDSDEIDELIESAARDKSQQQAGGERPATREEDEPKSTDPDLAAADDPTGPVTETEESGDDQDRSGGPAGAHEPPESAERSGEPDIEGTDPPATHSRESEVEPEENENGVIDLDDVEIPKEEESKNDDKESEYDLDDIDALLDAEIARKHGKDS